MKFIIWFGLFAIMEFAHCKSPFFSTETEEIDSSEYGGPPGKKITTCDCGWTNKPGKRVAGGIESGINQYPFTAALLDLIKRTQFCGGTIISTYHVLTAAHCTSDYVKNGMPILVHVGEHDLTRGDESAATQKIIAKNIRQHEGYDPNTLIHDISVLVLDRPIEFNKLVGPACLSRNQLQLEKESVKLIGWGKTNFEGNGSPILNKVNLRVIPHNMCSKSYSKVNPSDRTQICTFAKKKGACRGDSGGPLVWLDSEINRYTLVGAVSFGRVCGGTDPTVFTDVTAYYSWIQSQIATSSRAPTCSKY